MAVSTPSPADVANNALTRLGFKLRVGSLLDGSDHARIILDLYGQTRDDLLRNFDYDFAARTGVLTQLKAAPVGGYFPPASWDPTVNPPLGFGFEYAFPDDALKIRIVKPGGLFIVNADPQPYDFSEYNDATYTPARRTIVTNVSNAIGVYTGRVTDPANWDVSFTEAFAAELARRIGPGLVGLDATKMEAADGQVQVAQSTLEGR